ncbi:MAG: DUF1249 domain-containing protein [Proteobacteria bacterium]|nr:DUF1249 domain-containing protein [Pseudomonadota bacterium]
MSQKRYNINLPAHMAECDANYLRVMKLFPALKDQDDCVFGVARSDNQPHLEVRIKVLERGPYTTLIKLVQLPESSWKTNPSMTIRIYHDARSAEVVEYQRARHFRAVYEYPNDKMHQRDEKAQVNRFLGEFLSLCLMRGVAVDVPAVVTES